MRSAGRGLASKTGAPNRPGAHLGCVAGAALAVLSGNSVASGAAAGVVPDGGSATFVSVGAEGRTTVGVAGTVGGVSVNTYRHFNVPRAGVDLDNRSVGARTILNQVTGTDPSSLEGPLTVLGPRANVVIANPNGVSVNGMTVRNVGNLALTTGHVAFNDFTTGNGSLQRNLILKTSGGAIDIGPEGLSGSLLNLELAAKRIRIGGKVENHYSDRTARIRAVAGDSRAEIDTSISPTDNLTPWIRYVAPSAAAGHDVALDITAAGGLTAGRIELLVTDQGAGVRHAGNALATAGDFIVSTAGDLHLNGAAIRARGDALIASGGLTSTGGVGRSTLSAAGAVRIRSGAVALHDTDIDGVAATDIRAGSILMRGSTVLSSGADVSLTSAGSYMQQDSDVRSATDIRLRAGTVLVESANRRSTVIANGGALLVDSEETLTNRGAVLQGRTRGTDEMASRGAVALNAGGSIVNASTPDYMGIVFGVDDDVVVKAGGDVVNHHARMLSNRFLHVDAAGDIRNETTERPHTNAAQPTYFNESGHRWLWLSKRTAGFDVDYGALDSPGQMAYLLSDKGTTLRGRNVFNQGGEIYANNGDIRIRADLAFHTEGIATGAAHYSRTCMIVCRTSASSTTTVIGGLLSAGGNIDIRAGAAASNVGGRVLALGELNVVAPVVYAAALTGYTALARDRGFKAFFGDTWARLYAADMGGNWIAASRGRIAGDTIVDGGSFDGAIEIDGNTMVLRPRQRIPVVVESHLGMTSWLWQ